MKCLSNFFIYYRDDNGENIIRTSVNDVKIEEYAGTEPEITQTENKLFGQNVDDNVRNGKDIISLTQSFIKDESRSGENNQ